MTVTLLVSTAAAAQAEWPPFLPPASEFAPAVSERIEHVWKDRTLSRTVRGAPAPVPFSTYLLFIDAPDVTTAAARHLGIGKDEVHALGGDLYEATDHDGATGRYRILLRAPRRRVILSWGEHHGALLGTIKGSALTVLDFEPGDDEVTQTLTTYVLIDNRVAAALARMLVPVFGSVADRKLSEGFTIAAKVATWAVEKPDEFCSWLGTEPIPVERRERVLDGLPRCGDERAHGAPPPRHRHVAS